jgi:hypothetical protein
MSKEYLALVKFASEERGSLTGWGLVSYSEGILRFRMKQIASNVAFELYSDEAVVSAFDNTPLSFKVSPESFLRYIRENSTEVLDDKATRALNVVLNQCYEIGYEFDFMRLASLLEEKVRYDQWKMILRSLSRGENTFEEKGVSYG